MATTITLSITVGSSQRSNWTAWRMVVVVDHNHTPTRNGIEAYFAQDCPGGQSGGYGFPPSPNELVDSVRARRRIVEAICSSFFTAQLLEGGFAPQDRLEMCEDYQNGKEVRCSEIVNLSPRLPACE